MEGKNLILAISLSAFVLIMWSVFFAPPLPTIDKEQNKIEKTQKENDISSPSLEPTKGDQSCYQGGVFKNDKKNSCRK